MKINKLIAFSLSSIIASLIAGCSMFAKQQESTPLPPQNINMNKGAAPAAANLSANKSAKIESNNYTESQSQYKRRQIVEDRGPGGAVNKITVDNAGNVPDYVLYPTDQTQYNTNDNPDRLSVPNWQINW